LRLATATAFDDATLVRLDKDVMMRVLHNEPAFAELFMAHLLAHNIRSKRTWWINSSIPARSG
jgi:CRP/FNR family transcriptional regulator, cyclic AMP receptor protein